MLSLAFPLPISSLQTSHCWPGFCFQIYHLCFFCWRELDPLSPQFPLLVLPKFPTATLSALTLSVGSCCSCAPQPNSFSLTLCSGISSSFLSFVCSAASHQILLFLAAHPQTLLLFSLWGVSFSLCLRSDLCWVGPSGEIAGVGVLTIFFARVLLAEGGSCVGVAIQKGRNLMLFWKLMKA